MSRYRVERDGEPDAACARELYDEREDGDVVQPVADLGDDLPRPEPLEVRVRREQPSVSHKVRTASDSEQVCATRRGLST